MTKNCVLVGHLVQYVVCSFGLKGSLIQTDTFKFSCPYVHVIHIHYMLKQLFFYIMVNS